MAPTFATAGMSRANDVEAGQRVLAGMPLFWIGGVSHSLGPVLHLGNTLVTTPKFDPAGALDLIEQRGVTQLQLFPNMVQRLRDHLVEVGRDAASVPLLNPPVSNVPADRRTSSLGMTETCAACMASGPRGHVIPEEFRGALGSGVPMTQYVIVDLEKGEPLPDGEEGEICVRGFSLMMGMCKKERHEIFDDGGWYHTGDKGYIRGEYMFFTGRSKDLIKTAGANVAPREVEAVLDVFPELLFSVVVGLPDAERSEIVGAVMIPATGQTVDAVEVVTRANEVLSSYKVPRRVLVVAESDVSYVDTGKPDRQTLAARLA